jgi:NAD(P)-dependent dehydrogenase (short-subunit alcohol dehydrogenase family)
VSQSDEKPPFSFFSLYLTKHLQSSVNDILSCCSHKLASPHDLLIILSFRSTGFHFTPTLHNDTYPAISSTLSNLTGKTILITGASRGIGRAIAISYARAGASSIAILARSEDALNKVARSMLSAATAAKRLAPKIMACIVDVTSRTSVEDTATAVEKALGHIDILINNAGYLEDFKLIADSDPDEWWKTHEVNVKGPYLITRSFLPLLLKGTEKTIVQLSSIGAHITNPGGSAYEMTKSAVLRMNDFIAAEYGEQGILVYGIHPGGVLTELASKLPNKSILIDTLELSADTVVWLTRERREWLQDRYVSCTWDMEELEGMREEIVKRDLLKVRMAV